jgi:hypothetical protein
LVGGNAVGGVGAGGAAVIVFLDDVGEAVAARVVFGAGGGAADDGDAVGGIAAEGSDDGVADDGTGDGAAALGAIDDPAGALFGAAVEQPATLRIAAIDTEQTIDPTGERANRRGGNGTPPCSHANTP